MKKLLKHLIPFLLAVLITSPAWAITMQGTQGSTMQGGPATMQGGESSFDPLSLSPIALFDSLEASSFVFSSGFLILQWNDLSVYGNHLVQTDPSKQPTWDPVNKRVIFDGVDDFMSTGNFVGGDVAQPNSIFSVWSYITPTSNKYLYDNFTGPNRNFLIITAGDFRIGNTSTIPTGLKNTDENISIAEHDGASTTHYLNGGTAAGSGDAGSKPYSGLNLNSIQGGGFTAHAYHRFYMLLQNKLDTAGNNEVGFYLENRFDPTNPWTDIP